MSLPSAHFEQNVDNKAKGRISKRVFQKKQSTSNFPKKNIFLTPDTHTYQGVKKCSFFGKFGVLCFLETPVLRFTLLPYYRRNSYDVINDDLATPTRKKKLQFNTTPFKFDSTETEFNKRKNFSPIIC